MKISLAIPTFNRPELTMESFAKVLSNEHVDEIVIVDDHSDVDQYVKLFEGIFNLNTKKIRLRRNAKNLGPLMNKYEAVKMCSNPWVVLLDSDNIIDDNYIEVLSNIKHKNDFVLYCPEKLLGLDGKVQWDYSEFTQLSIDRHTAKANLEVGNFEACMNTGNYLVNRAMYLQVNENSSRDDLLRYNDAMYFSYLWLFHGNMMKIVPNLHYIHRLHNGSWYRQNRAKCRYATEVIKNLVNAF